MANCARPGYRPSNLSNTPETGAGIATLIDVQGVPPGNVDLFAPDGTVDAAEAGIRVSGNFTVAVPQVLNIGNISGRARSAGIPTVQAPPVAILTATSNTAAVRASGRDGPLQKDSQAGTKDARRS
jgi:filamentous hemagglutinin